MASLAYNAFRYRQLGDTGITPINLKTDTIKLALLTSSYTPDQDAHDFYDDVSANEVAASGTYSAGGVTLTASMSQDNTNDRGVFDASDVSITGATITARYGVVYKSTGTASTSPLICVLDFAGNITSIVGTFSITFSASGILYIG